MGDFSGKFVLRVPPHLHEQLKQQALASGVSLNSWILDRLQTEKRASGELFNKVLALLKKQFQEEFIGLVLFGSAARGDQRESSDIDLLIVFSEEKAITRSLYRIWDDEIAPHLDKPFEPQFVHLPNREAVASSIWLEVAIEGQILFDTHFRVALYLQKLRSLIAEGFYQRKMSHGHPYWLHKEKIDAK